jgi:hypothetical protein
MRNVWSTASIIVLGLSVAGVQSATAQTGFEGTLTYEIHTANGKTMTLLTMNKGNKMRMEMSDPENPMHSGAFVVDGDAHTRMMVLNSQKKYIVFPESMANMMNKGAGVNTPHWTFTKTGRTETVAGVSCEVMHGSGSNNGTPEEADACIAKGVGFNPGTFASMSAQGGAADPSIAAIRDAIGPGNGVVKVTTTKDGKPDMTMEVTKIDRSPVSSDEFSPPAGYTAIQMPAGMPPGAGAGAPR